MSTNVLSPRMREVATLAAAGMMNRDIAEKLDITEGTVRQYLHLAYRSLGVRDRIHLTIRWMQGTLPELTPVN